MDQVFYDRLFRSEMEFGDGVLYLAIGHRRAPVLTLVFRLGLAQDHFRKSCRICGIVIQPPL